LAVNAEPATPSPQAAASAVVAALERAWSAIRAHHPDVPQVIVVLGAGSETRRGLFKWGHFAAARWQVADTNRPEVLVSGEGLKRGARAVLATLLHEAAHGLANTRGVKDTSRQGRWHNRRFATLAGELGLQVAKDSKTGWSQTSLTDRLAGRYADQLIGLDAALQLWRHTERQLGPATVTHNLLAGSCECGRKLRVAKATLEQAPIICGACKERFEPERALTLRSLLPKGGVGGSAAASRVWGAWWRPCPAGRRRSPRWLRSLLGGGSGDRRAGQCCVVRCRHNLSRLWVPHSSFHSASQAASPRRRNRRTPCCSLI
jgi:hypothetical protein